MMPYTAPERNYDGIQFEKVRRAIEQPFNDEHDRLSAAHYGKTEYVACDGTKWGILDRATFDKLHGLIFFHLQVAFHEYNVALPLAEQVPEAQYNAADPTTDSTPVQQAQAAIAQAAAEGVSLVVDWRNAQPLPMER